MVLFVVAYCVATSSAFLRHVILPRVSKSIGADITVENASIHPFSEVLLQHLKVEAPGTTPVLTADEVRARYSLWAIMRGNINVDEIALTAPIISIVEQTNGSRNIDVFLKQQTKAQAPAKPSAPAKTSAPPEIDVRKIALDNATVRYVKEAAGGGETSAVVSNIDLEIDNIKNGAAGKLTLNAGIALNNKSPAPATNSAAQAKLAAAFDFSLANDLQPSSVKGNAHVDVSGAEGAMAPLAALAVRLDCEVTPTDIRQVALEFQRSGTPLGEIRVSGPFDSSKTEGKLAVEIRGIDKQLLNIVGSSSGADFGGTTLNSTNLIELTHAGGDITASGRINLAGLQVARAGQRTPTLDLLASYVVAVDSAANNAVIRRLDIVGTQNQQPLLATGLSAPMTLAWGNAANAVGDAALNLTITNFNLGDWKVLLGDTASGVVGAQVRLLSQQAGKRLAFDARAGVQNLTVNSTQPPTPPADVEFQASGQALDLSQVAVTNFLVRVARQNQQMLSVSGTATYDVAKAIADAQIDVGAAIPLLLEMAPQSGAAFSSGSMTLQAHVAQKPGAASATGQLALTGLTGKFGQNELRDFDTTVNVDVGQTGQLMEIRKAAGQFNQSGKPGGNFDVSGQYDSSKQAGQLTARLVGLNENLLRSFLAPALGDKTLSSILINATVTSQYDAHAESAVKADLQVSNLVVLDPTHQIPATPLEARVQMDGSLRQQAVDVRQLELTLTPTDRARNDLRLTGKVDLSQPGAYSGNVKIAADSLDFTRYYDLFTAGTNAPANPTPAAPAAPAVKPAGGPEKEPAPVSLPFRNFTLDADIGQLYLREVAATNLQTTIKIDGGHVVLNPFQVVLNGAPIKINLDGDLSVPGYKYTAAVDGDRIPFAPLVDTFAPDRKGQLGGWLNAHVHVAGAGITGANLQKNLAGQLDISTTNLDLSVINIRSPVLKRIVDVVAILPSFRNPVNGASSLFDTISGSQSGVLEDLQQSPIDVITVQAAVANGRVDLKSADIRSLAFAADVTNGVSLLASNLDDSTLDLPVTISLSPAVARKTGLAAANSSGDAYVKLPDFLTITGTYAAPKENIDKGALAKAALKGATGGAEGVLHGIGNLINGQSSTNAPATNNPVNKLLHNLFRR